MLNRADGIGVSNGTCELNGPGDAAPYKPTPKFVYIKFILANFIHLMVDFGFRQSFTVLGGIHSVWFIRYSDILTKVMSINFLQLCHMSLSAS